MNLDERATRAARGLDVATESIRPRRAPMRDRRALWVIATAAVFVVAGLVAVSAGRRSTSSSHAAAPMTATARAERAETILNDLLAGKFDGVRVGFDPRMRSELSAALISLNWRNFVRAFGAYRSRGRAVETVEGTYRVVNIPLVMTNMAAQLRVTFDANGQIGGLFLLRGEPQTGPSILEPSQAQAALAAEVIQLLRSRAFDRVTTTFDDTLKVAISAEHIAQVWDALTQQQGAVRTVGFPAVVPAATTVLYDYPLSMDRGQAHLQIAINAQIQVAGLVIKPGPTTGVFGE
jgi:hypothetical protein